MKVARLLIANLAMWAFSTGCSVAVDSDGSTTGRRSISIGDDHAGAFGIGSCRFVLGRGCLNGHVGAMQNFFVDGKEFFNADDLSVRLDELLHVESQGRLVTKGDGGFALTVLTPLDNESFVSGFRYDLSGQLARSGDIRRDGQFNIDNLPIGDYQLRVQRAVRFRLSSRLAGDTTPNGTKPERPHSDTEGTPDTVPTLTLADRANYQGDSAKLFCATLYSDSTIAVRENQNTWLDLNRFRLHLSASECAHGDSQATLSI